MSIVDIPTAPGEELTAETVSAAVARVFIGESQFPVDPDNQRAFVLGALSDRVATFLNAHPEHRAALLPDPDTTDAAW